MSKKGFKNANTVTLRLFPGMDESSTSFEVVKVSGDPTTIAIDALLDKPDQSNLEINTGDCQLTFDGYFPDDGYDYTQHLREINQARFVPALKQPSSKIAASNNRDLAEVMAALNAPDDADFEELDANFAERLGPIDEKTKIAMLWGEDQVEEYMTMPTDKLMAIHNRLMEREKRAQTPLEQDVDKEFDAFFAREFGDDQIGGLNPEDVDIEEEEFDSVDESESDMESDEDDPERIRQEASEFTKRMVAQNESLQISVVDGNDDLSDIVIVPVSNVPEWDCESVLSTRSNIYNHPGVIGRPRREKPVAHSIEVLAEESSEDDSIETPVREVSTFRKKDETTDERRERKKAIKAFQREQREAKKSEKRERKEAVNKAKIQVAISKHVNYGDVPTGVPKFAL